MDSATLLQEFEDLSERMSIRIRYGKLDGEGGLCRYREEYHIVVNKRLDTEGRIEVMSRIFAQFPLEEVFLIPAIRDAIEQYKDRANAHVPDDLETSSESGENP
jgi:hypothetical protein